MSAACGEPTLWLAVVAAFGVGLALVAIVAALVWVVSAVDRRVNPEMYAPLEDWP